MNRSSIDREKHDKQFFDIGSLGLIGLGLGSLAGSISVLSLGDSIVGAVFLAIGLILINSWKEPCEYRIDYLKWTTVFLGLSFIAYPVIFIMNNQPVSSKLLFLMVSVSFSLAAIFCVLKVKKRLFNTESGGSSRSTG